MSGIQVKERSSKLRYCGWRGRRDVDLCAQPLPSAFRGHGCPVPSRIRRTSTESGDMPCDELGVQSLCADRGQPERGCRASGPRRRHPCPQPGGCGDKCPNIDGHQVLVPTGLFVDANGNCVPIDVCPEHSRYTDVSPCGLPARSETGTASPFRRRAPTRRPVVANASPSRTMSLA